jgi:hypothetical protein
LQEEDVEFEENILRNAYSVKAWLRYLDHKPLSKRGARFVIYERALRELPGRLVSLHDGVCYFSRFLAALSCCLRPLNVFVVAVTILFLTLVGTLLF